MNKELIISGTGFPGTNKTLRYLNEAPKETFGALAQLLGNKSILTGVTPVGDGTCTAGWISYNNMIIPFQAGVIESTVTIVEEIDNAFYNTVVDNTVLLGLPAYKRTFARYGSGGVATFPATELVRLDTIKQLTEWEFPGVVFTQQMLNFLNSIVKSNWAEQNPASMAFIENKPNFLEILHKGSSIIGDIAGVDDIKTIHFPNIATADYIVLASIVSLSTYSSQAGVTLPGWDWDNDFSYVIVDKTATNFKIGLREYSSVTQNLQVDYILIKK